MPMKFSTPENHNFLILTKLIYCIYFMDTVKILKVSIALIHQQKLIAKYCKTLFFLKSIYCQQPKKTTFSQLSGVPHRPITLNSCLACLLGPSSCNRLKKLSNVAHVTWHYMAVLSPQVLDLGLEN